ncbi:hypothetical protein [Mesorhizobium sp. DCY119]|uniref:hypothetical protein n=1 Tax=Mesorhizobium sp. DCY119 TaxID=2108445 RepID=UPI000E7719BA|nr:hypothetical protein [Mesorhizobium sp. DCY119]RJG46486.1 hypothetical protein D3Y55_21065 [Mesorhizobium sp. DCY119]
MWKIFAAAIAALSLSAFPAFADDPNCAPTSAMASVLKSEFNETPASYGVATDKVALVIFVSPGGETWSAVAVGTDGMACLLQSGKYWTDKPAGQPS